MNPPFFVVWRRHDRAPKLQHATESEAEIAAGRLAADHPGEEFFVMAPVASFRVPIRELDPIPKSPPEPRKPWGAYTRGRWP